MTTLSAHNAVSFRRFNTVAHRPNFLRSTPILDREPSRLTHTVADWCAAALNLVLLFGTMAVIAIAFASLESAAR